MLYDLESREFFYNVKIHKTTKLKIKMDWEAFRE